MRKFIVILFLLVTWGLDIYAYGRAQRVSGFATEELCNRIRESLQRKNLERRIDERWRIAEKCNEDI